MNLQYLRPWMKPEVEARTVHGAYQLHTEAERHVNYYQVKSMQRPHLKGASSCLILLEDSIYKMSSSHLTQ